MNDLHKIGDYVIHKRYGVGEIVDINYDKKIYSIVFCDTGFHRVKFSTEMVQRENDDYEIVDIIHKDRISIRYMSFEENCSISEDFSPFRFIELSRDGNVIYHNGEKYKLLNYKVRSICGHTKVISERFCIAHRFSPMVNVSFKYATDEVFARYLELYGKHQIQDFSKEDEELFKYNVSEKYGVEL